MMLNYIDKISQSIQSKTFGKILKSRIKNLFGINDSKLDDTITSKERYKRFNLNQLQIIEKILNNNGYSLKKFNSIFEFGCGFGRLTEHLFDLLPNTSIYGSDVENKFVMECKKKFSKGNFIVNEFKPPLNLTDQKFDFIFSYSVFTHLTENNHIAWLKELKKFLNKNGVMLHTTHSFECLKRLNIFSPNSLNKYNLKNNLNDILNEKNTYHFAAPKNKSDSISSDDPLNPEYGLTIISKDYILNNWEGYSGLKIIDYVDAAVESNPEGCQDIVLLKNNK